MKLDWKLTALTIGLWIVLLPVFSITHEYGHAFACSMQGNEYEIHISLVLNYVQCLGEVEDPTSFRMFGGFVSATLAFMIFAGLKPVLTGASKSIGIVLVVIGITQFVNMIMETFANSFYMNSGGIMTGVNTLMAMIMLFFLIQRHSPRPKYKIFKKQQYHDVPKSIFKRSITDIIKGRKPRPERFTQKIVEEKSYPTLDLLEEDAYENYEDDYEYEEEEE